MLDQIMWYHGLRLYLKREREGEREREASIANVPTHFKHRNVGDFRIDIFFLPMIKAFK